MQNYDDFLKNKAIIRQPTGKQISAADVHPILFPFQRDSVVWAVHKGTCAILFDTGLGKTICQVEWGRLIGGRGLIIAPLTVALQTVQEAKNKLGVEVHYTRSKDDLSPTLNITNYEMIEHFDPQDFEWVVLDESSILKSLNSKTRQLLTDMFAGTRYKLCCTATPAPNDIKEIGYHAEFLGLMRQREMLSCFFRYSQAVGMDRKESWRLKKHAVKAFYRWLASWALAIKKPSDMGYSDEGYNLPPLTIETYVSDSHYTPDGMLPGFGGLDGISAIEAKRLRHKVMESRIQAIFDLVNSKSLEYNLGYQTYSGDNENDTRGTKSLQSGMVQEKSRQSKSAEDKRQGQEESETTGAVRDRHEIQGSSEAVSKGLGKKESRKSKSSKRSSVRIDDGTVQQSIGETELSVRDLRIFGHDSEKHISSGRSLSLNEKSAGIALHELQHGIGEVQGQYRNSGTSDSLPKKQWTIWCGLNDEQDRLELLFGDRCISVYGSLPPEEKAKRILAFQNGEYEILLSKASICGFGVNLQNCSEVALCGIDYSWESYYQQIRRFWRFGQKNPVNVHIFIDQQETAIFDEVQKKEREATSMTANLIAAMREYTIEELKGLYHDEWKYAQDEASGENWRLLLGDSCLRMKEIPDNSIDISVYSPPFSDLFVYSATPHDLGNSATREEFFEHYGFIIRENLRITKPGRMCFVHCNDLRSYLNADGYIGLKDFSGDVIAEYQKNGWVFQHRITIQKNPQTQAVRLKDHRLLFITLEKDSLRLTGGQPDYILMFSKPGESEVPVKPIENENLTVDEWQRLWIQWAAPVWTDIRETDVLPVAQAKATEDEKHMCPLQLPVIERCLRLWSNPGETLFSPFAGVGSEGYEALRWKRKFLGIELKPEYFNVAKHNLQNAQNLNGQDLFAWARQQQESEVIEEA